MPSACEEIDQDIREISQDPKYSKWFAYAPKRVKSRGGKKVGSSTTTAPSAVFKKNVVPPIQASLGNSKALNNELLCPTKFPKMQSTLFEVGTDVSVGHGQDIIQKAAVIVVGAMKCIFPI
ncbi:uncharacterized protein EV420DRAFT_1485490 [Desarmillaria tabescens]|uniref:Uncharacterized protein n=1 Tax=Armillaria tabescens TaxID=1929756 RepID=A0AA39JH98_ARMTA|nr:uncharacterized protein EV420DRAFT_1485490 [Desarmillaria tabescens]KAK0441746.1 hypothetical protein EV420DRAFT_1485490 [Desarmillaria tabescens]